MKEMKQVGEGVIPANAGVILFWRLFIQKLKRYPRECGGDPEGLMTIS